LTPIEQEAREIAERHGYDMSFGCTLPKWMELMLCEALLTTPEEEKMKQLGGGTANNMRAFGWEVRAPSDPTDCASFEVSNRHRPEQVWLAKDEAEGWQIAEREQGLRGIQQIKPTPTKPDEPTGTALIAARDLLAATERELASKPSPDFYTSEDFRRNAASLTVARLLVERAEHPNAADWRNRAERAEAQLAEVLAERGEPVAFRYDHPSGSRHFSSVLHGEHPEWRDWAVTPLYAAKPEPKEDPDLVLAREMADAVQITPEEAFDAIKHLREAGWKEGV